MERGWLDAGVDRVVGDRLAMAEDAKYFTPTGDVTIPVVSLHSYVDPRTRFFHVSAASSCASLGH